MNKNVKRKLKKEFDEAVEKVKLSVENSEVYLKVFAENGCENKKAPQNKLKTPFIFRSKKAFALMASSLAVLITVSAIFLSINISAIKAQKAFTVFLCANSSVELCCNESGTITEAKGIDKEGVKLLFLEEFEGKSYSEAISKIIYLMDKYNYIGSENLLKYAVFGSKAEDYRATLLDCINWNISLIPDSVAKADVMTSSEEKKIKRLSNDFSESLIEETYVEYKAMLSEAVNEKIELLISATKVLQSHVSDSRIEFTEDEKAILRKYVAEFSNDIAGYSLPKLTGTDAAALAARFVIIENDLVIKQTLLDTASPTNNWLNVSRDVLELAKTLMNQII